MTATAKPLLRWWGARVDLLAGAVVFVLINSLIQVSLRSLGESGPSAGESVGYLTLAAATFVLLVVGFAVSVSQRRTPAIVSYPIVSLVALGTVLFFALPFIQVPSTPDYPLNPGGCYRTDSENCPGG